MYFDAHSDIWADVTNKRLAGETDVIQKFHIDRLKKGNVEGAVFVMWVDPPYDRDYMARTRDIFRCVKDELAETKAIRSVKNFEEIMQARKDGEFYVLTGIEGMAYGTVIKMCDKLSLNPVDFSSLERDTSLGAQLLENRVMQYYVKLNQTGRDKILELMDDFVQIDKYKAKNRKSKKED